MSCDGWTVCPGDKRWVAVPGIVKPINCGSADRARLVAAAPRMRDLLQEALMPDLSKPLRGSEEWLKDVRDLLEDEVGPQE